MTPLHKKIKKDLKENYRPVSILPTYSKVIERNMFAQMSSSFNTFCQNNNVTSGKSLLEKQNESVNSGQCSVLY